MKVQESVAQNNGFASAMANEAFLPAFTELIGMLSLRHGCLLMEAAHGYLQAFRPDDFRNPLDSMPMLVAGPVVITLLHVTMGTPLFMNDALLDLWVKCDGTVAECSRCGYRHPAGIHICSVCGGLTGEGGCWARSRARVADAN